LLNIKLVFPSYLFSKIGFTGCNVYLACTIFIGFVLEGTIFK